MINIDNIFSDCVKVVTLDIQGVKVQLEKVDEGYRICIDDPNNIILHVAPDGDNYIHENYIYREHEGLKLSYWCCGLYDVKHCGGFRNHDIFPLEHINIILDAIEDGVKKLNEIVTKPEITKIGKITITITSVPSKPGYVKMKIDGMKTSCDLKLSKYMWNLPRCSYYRTYNEFYVTTNNVTGIQIVGCIQTDLSGYVKLNEPMTVEAANRIIECIRECVNNYDTLKNTEVIKCGNVTITKTIIDESMVSLAFDGLPTVNEYTDEFTTLSFITLNDTFLLYENNKAICIDNKYHFPIKDFKVIPEDADRIISIIRKSEEKLAKYKEAHRISNLSWPYIYDPDKSEISLIIQPYTYDKDIKVGDTVKEVYGIYLPEMKVISIDNDSAWIKNLRTGYSAICKISHLTKVEE